MSAAARVADPAGPSLAGKVALVVGTSANIGAGIALELGAAGASVACLDRNATLAELCSGDLVAAGVPSVAVSCDVTDESALAAALDTVQAALGPVDVLVNGATRYNEKGIHELSLAEWREQLEIILTSAFVATREVTRRLVALGAPGSIVNLTSTAAHQGEPNHVGYSTAKGGLLNFTRSVAMELAADGIRVNSLTPTSTDPAESLERLRRWGLPTADAEKLTERMAEVARLTPLGQLPAPSDYGRAAVFLASDASRMVTGTDLRVDSGTVARYWRWTPGTDHRAPTPGA